jgi:hypothetical protein
MLRLQQLRRRSLLVEHDVVKRLDANLEVGFLPHSP